jgi:predicted Zn-dependent protease
MNMRALLPSLLLVLAVISGCATNPVTGNQDFVLMSEQDEINLGKQVNQQVLQQYQVYSDPSLQDYVQYVGAKVAARSDRPNLQYHFTVLDSDEVNAFALPGGWIYITRGIMAYLNSEAELAAVLGHEIGHVAARHAVRQYSARQLTGLGAALGSIFVPGLNQVAGQQLVGLLGTALLRGYGREQELEADKLGAKYLARSGYNPEAMMDVLRTLKNQEVVASAEAAKTAKTTFIGRTDYLRRIDGLVFGKDTRNGIIKGRDFYHGGMDFAVRFPQHWQIHNLPDRVVAMAPANDAMLQLSTLPADPRQTPQQFMAGKLGLKSVSRGQAMTLHGLPAYTATGMVNTSNGQSLARITVIYHQQRAFILAGMTRGGSLGGYDSAFLQTAHSFRPLTSAEQAYALRTNHVELVQANAGTSFKELAAQAPLEKFPEDQIRLLNAMYPQGKIRPGELIKTVAK